MEANGVDYSLVLSSYKVNKDRPSTRQIVEVISHKKNLGVVAGVSYLNYNHRDIREIGEYLETGLIRGL